MSISRPVRTGLRQDCLDFRDREDGEEPHEEKEERGEDTKAADEDHDVDDGREEHVPFARQERLVKRSDDDDEAFKPHADRDQEAYHEDDEWAGAEFLDPEELR